MKTINRLACTLFAAALLGLGAAAAAQEQPTLKDVIEGSKEVAQEEAEPADTRELPPSAAAPPSQVGPVDDFDRGVPRTAVEGFIEAARNRDWERAAAYLDLRNLPRGMDARNGPRLAEELKIVLDRALWIDYASLSASPEGHAEDGLPAYRDRVGVIDMPDGKVEVLLQQVPREDGVLIWKISNRTVGAIPKLFAQYRYGPLAERLTAALPEFEVLGLESWQWVGMFVLGAATFALSWTITAVLAWAFRRRGTELGKRSADLFSGSVRFLLFVLLFGKSMELLAPTLALRAIMSAGTLSTVATAWVSVRLAGLLFEILGHRLDRRRPGSKVLLRPLETLTTIVIVFVAVLVWLGNVGYNVTTLVAGLGIGGVAVALAAQKSLEDVFGAVTVYGGRPVAVGDFCRFGDRVGTVEEIGLRWTRVRTLDDTLVSMPTGEFAQLALENFARRTKIWFHPTIRLRYETTPDQLRCVPVEIRTLFYSHPRVLADPARIRFVGFGESSLDLEVFAYVETTDYGEYLEIAEDLYLRIMTIIEEAGSGLALPARTQYVAPEAGLDTERAHAAEARVDEWRKQRELYLPRFPDERIAALRGSLPYPPEGAPTPADVG
jgi:MscS family membrane protein